MAATVIPNGSTKMLSGCWGCANCRQLIYCDDFNDDDHIGSCPAGNKHNAGCGEFKLVDTGAGESGYKFCKTCAGFYLASSATAGACAGGASHTPDAGLAFTLNTETRDDTTIYSYPWQRCKKCNCIFLSNSGGNGTCGKGGKHEAASNDVYTCTKKADN